MSIPSQTKQWHLVNKPIDYPTLTGPTPTFKQVTTDLPALKPNQLLLKTLYLSNDPAQRGWISKSIAPDRLYVPPVPLNTPMRSRGLAEIVASTAEDASLAKGKYVTAHTNWTEYCVVNAKDCVPVSAIDGVSLTQFLGALGTTGLTAYYGLVEIAQATKDDTVVISGAAGATGSMVVQIAKKMVGCKRVIGMAGSDDKCEWVRSLGADVCLNYKKDSFEEDLVKATEGFVEIYFDNVGGSILDLMLTRIARFGRVAACGAISNYNNESSPTGLRNYFQVVSNRLNIRGFLVLDYLHKSREVTEKFLAALQEGKIRLSDDMETVVPTKFEDVPGTWMRLFEGMNQGKLITQLT